MNSDIKQKWAEAQVKQLILSGQANKAQEDVLIAKFLMMYDNLNIGSPKTTSSPIDSHDYEYKTICSFESMRSSLFGLKSFMDRYSVTKYSLSLMELRDAMYKNGVSIKDQLELINYWIEIRRDIISGISIASREHNLHITNVDLYYIDHIDSLIDYVMENYT